MFEFFKKKREEKRIEQEKIRQEEEIRLKQEKIKIEEENRKFDERVKQRYNEDMKNMSYEFGKYEFNIMCNIISLCEFEAKNEDVFSIDFDNIEKFFKVVYRDTYSITKLDEFTEYTTKNMSKIIFEGLGYDFKYSYEKSYFDGNVKQEVKNLLIQEFNSQMKLYNFKEYVYEILDDTKKFNLDYKLVAKINKRYQKEQEEDFNKSMSMDTLLSWRPYAKYVISLVICLYNFLITIMFLVVLSRQKKKYIENSELFTIADNLYGQFEDEEALNKLFNVYEGIYNGALAELYTGNSVSVYNKQVIGILTSFLYDNMKNYRSSTILNLEEKTMEKALLENVEIINYEVLKDIMYKYINTELDNIYFFHYYYVFILFKYKDKVEGNDLLYYLWKSWDIESEVKNRKKEEDLIKEKERYLNGNFEKEMALENEKLKFDSVKTGIEFEEYLKNIFEKFGYIVELTKTTGDQGADLIITKGNLKTVVQAKFYSSPVGNKAVQEVVSAIKFYNADNGMVLTNNCYTKSAIELADANNIVLWDGDVLKGNVEKLMF